MMRAYPRTVTRRAFGAIVLTLTVILAAAVPRLGGVEVTGTPTGRHPAPVDHRLVPTAEP